MTARAWAAAGLAAAASAGLAAALLPGLHFTWREPTLKVALEMTGGFADALVTYLLWGRFRQTRRLADLLLVCALGCAAFSNLFFTALPTAVAEDWDTTLVASARTPAHLLGAVAFVASALLDARPAGPGLTRVVALAFLGALAAVGAAALLAGGASPPGPAGDADSSRVAVHLVGIAVFLTAAVLFARRGLRRGDELLLWLALAAGLGALTRVSYALHPELQLSPFLSTGDAFRLVLHVVLLAAALREISRHWRELAVVAVAEERRRIARDLHDGVAQELALIAQRARGLEAGPGAQIAAAARRGLEDSRRAITALSRPLDEPLDISLARAATRLAAPGGVVLELDLARKVVVAPSAHDSLVRVASEAVHNAIAHGGARRVRLELSGGPVLSLRVSDDGSGFDPGALDPGPGRGHGLRIMRERTEALGGELAILARPGRGVVIEVSLP